MLAVLGSTQKIAGLVANTMANKAYFESTPKLPTRKSYARGLAIDGRRKDGKTKGTTPFSTI